jgi:hypothetical protein
MNLLFCHRKILYNSPLIFGESGANVIDDFALLAFAFR